MEYKIKKEVLEATLNYLASKPFAEVSQLIQALGTSEAIEEEESKKAKK